MVLGDSMKFYFGDISESSTFVRIEANSVEHAIRVFKVTELFPEKYVDKSYYKRDERGYPDREYDSALGRYISKFRCENPKIFIYSQEDSSEGIKVGELGLLDCIDVNFEEILHKPNLLQAPEITSDSEPNDILPVIKSTKVVSQINSKLELREQHDKLKLLTSKYELMVSEAKRALEVLNDELRKKQKVVYIIETFLGVNEEVVQLLEGEAAAQGSKLTLFQQKLYMDEEVGIWDDRDAQGIDFKNIEEFDEWIKQHYKTFAHKPLSIISWQIRRSDKDYGNTWENAQLNSFNKETYFLIRNGENLYRIWSDVKTPSKLFPGIKEYQKVYNDKYSWGRDLAIKELQKRHESYLYGLIAIQGLIERTDVLGTDLKSINLMGPYEKLIDRVEFVRDAEPQHWVTDGRPSWHDFITKNRSTISKGTRIVIAVRPTDLRLYGKDNDSWRCSPFKPDSLPPYDQWYLVEEILTRNYHDADFLIRYHLEDTIKYDSYTYEPIKRKNRIPFRLYKDEVINFDGITLEEVDYYLKNRMERRSYLDILPVLTWIKKIKFEEKELEDGFTKMIAGKLSWELNPKNLKSIQEAIDWWKLKNRIKRAITKKDSTAIRMIVKRLKQI